ncbi:SbcC/MukB-like Walker B domain-containing protein [Mycobacterium haemophilum]
MTSIALEEAQAPPAGDPARFGRRWRLVSAGLSNVWRYGDLVLPAPSGRLLLRGPNGTGKTTALEALWPFLLDLDKQKLRAGTSRTTTLTSLMREGHNERKRVGYAWLTFAGPGDEGLHSYGARLMFVNGATPSVKVEPFTIPGEPVKDMALKEGNSAITSAEAFRELVESVGGMVFKDEDEYVTALGNHVFSAARADLIALAERVRRVRNPSLLADTSANHAAQALREALPGVAGDVIEATGDALAATEETRAAFQRDQDAATVLTAFAEAWGGHAADVAQRVATAAETAHRELAEARRQAEQRRLEHENSIAARQRADDELETATNDHEMVRAEIEAIIKSPAYETIGRLADLRETAAAQGREADAKIEALDRQVRTLRRESQRLTTQAGQLAAAIEKTCARAIQSDPRAGQAAPTVLVTTRPYATLTVAGQGFDPGPDITLRADPDKFTTATQAWSTLAEHHTTRANEARLMLREHRTTVGPAAEKARHASQQADHADESAERAAQDRDRKTTQTSDAASRLGTAISTWAATNPDLSTTPDSDPLDADTVGEAVAEGPAALLANASDWALTASRLAEAIAAKNTAAAEELTQRAALLHEEADAARRRAQELREGRDIPPPRPEWASPADDSAFANSLQWADNVDDHTRALVESALAASGVLGATLTRRGIHQHDWTIVNTTPTVTPNLTELVEADPAHELADTTRQILARIGRSSTAADAFPEAAAVIGTDGTFRIGVITGRAPGADDPAVLPAPSHIGAAHRRTAALAEAARLETEAEQHDSEAAEYETTAHTLREDARRARERATTFPSLQHLEEAERQRANASFIATERRDAAEKARQAAATALQHAREVHEQWRLKLTAMALPVDVDELETTKESAEHAASTLRGLTETLAGQRFTLTQVVEHITEHATERDGLPALHAKAAAAHADARRAMLEYERLEADHGKDAAELSARLEAAKTREREKGEWLEVARQYSQDAVRAEAEAKSEAARAFRATADKQAPASAALADLQGLMGVLDVAESVLPGVDMAPGEGLIAQILATVTAMTTYGKRKVAETYENARAELAGVWAVDRTDGYGDKLDTYQCSYDGEALTPVTAAKRARELAERASERLHEAEETALRDFIVGRLPAAIGAAWVEQRDWVKDVNRKMKSASASSGVGVQVSTTLRDDMTVTQRTVHRLACLKSAATRTLDEDKELAEALKSLLSAADGETVTDRVRQAVDVRDWVRVDYHVHRPGQEPKRWTRNTGLSGGERRLVILAPMLASIAALYDNFAPTALRLAALDEVPAEVDERGREGLARYIAELDLDVICTSYLWDGAPGAWDGVDAHDLEASDGIVVAFPMLVRGLDPLPGDPDAAP